MVAWSFSGYGLLQRNWLPLIKVEIPRQLSSLTLGIDPSFGPGKESRPVDENCFPSLECYLPTNIRIPASSASALINLLGITKRTNDGRPLRISQTANSIIPTDISAPPLLYEFLSSFPPNPCRSKDRRETPRLKESILCDRLNKRLRRDRFLAIPS